MNEKEFYDMIMGLEKQENLMHIDNDRKESISFENQEYLDVAFEACKKFNSECYEIIDAETLDKPKLYKRIK